MQKIQLLFLLCLGCGAATSSVETPESDRLHPHHLYPLTLGNAWSYDVDMGDEQSVLAITRVIAVKGSAVQVLVSREVRNYELRDQGIFRPGNGTWLLKSPIRVGAEWPSASGMTARVVSVDSHVNTPHGKFENCVEILEKGGQSVMQITTMYCPGVGPVFLESEAITSSGRVRVIGRLLGYQVSR